MSSSFSRQEWFILATIIVLETTLGLTALLIYKGIARHPWIFAAGMVGVGLTAAYLILEYWKGSRTDRRSIAFAVAANLCTLVLLAVVGEVIVRIGATPSSQGLSFAQIRLAPRDWQVIVEWNRDLLHRSSSNISYFVQDSLLGWTVGPSRRSKDGLYLSSREGIRSPEVGIAYSEVQELPRIAIVGDSYTFGLEVPFESTWGKKLEEQLPFRVQVLNFGVDGYGVDQAYLRYHRDVRPWHADVVIFGFINHDLYRTMVVYPFVSFPEWGFPFSKPRFTLVGGQLELLTTSLQNPEALFSVKSVAELPHIEYDPGYDGLAWEYKWFHRSFLVRLILGWFPRWPDPSPHASDDNIVAINAEILGRFDREAIDDGAIPYIVYFPSRGDFVGEERKGRDLVFSALRQKQLHYEDLTPCMRRAEYRDLFIEGHPHYSPKGNAVAAECLIQFLRNGLTRKT